MKLYKVIVDRQRVGSKLDMRQNHSNPMKHHIWGDEHPFTSLLIASCPPKCGWPSPKARWIAFWVTFAPEPTTRPWKCTARTHDFAQGVVGLKRFDWHLRFFSLLGTFKSHCLDCTNPQLWCLSHRAFGNGFNVSTFQPRPSWIAKAPAIGWPSSRVKFPLDRFRWTGVELWLCRQGQWRILLPPEGLGSTSWWYGTQDQRMDIGEIYRKATVEIPSMRHDLSIFHL